jgi:pyrroloquinoline quinone biosynthesis protein B
MKRYLSPFLSDHKKIGRREFIQGSFLASAVFFMPWKSSPLSHALQEKASSKAGKSKVMVKVLGTAQDGGFPQMACYCQNCQDARKNPELARKVVSLGLLDFTTGKSFMLDATPDAARQVEIIQAVDPLFMRKRSDAKPIDGLLLTHADVGHYTGLVQFRPEVAPVRNLPVYCSKIMGKFLADNEPWAAMVRHKIIELMMFDFNKRIILDENLEFEAVKVPHDKYSDMAGYKIYGPHKTLLFIPDINQWEERFLDIVASVDYAFVDGTFYSERRGSKIHPLIIDSMEFFKDIVGKTKPAIYFIHLNHSNRVLSRDKSVRETIEAKGFHVADDGQELWL